MTHMKKVHSSLLLSMDSCKVKGYFEQLGFQYLKGKNYFLSVQMKELLKEMNLTSFNAIDIRTHLDKQVEDHLFVSKQVKEEEISLLTDQLVRCLEYIQTQKKNILQRSFTGNIEIQDYTVTVTADFVFEDQDHIEMVKIKRSEPKLSYSGRKMETKPVHSMELFLLSELGKKFFPGKNIIASLYYLKSKDDTKNHFSPTFESKRGKNIISHSFTKEQTEAIEKRIVDLVSEKLSIDSEKADNPSLCENCSFQNICHYEKSKEEWEEVKEVKKAGDLKLTENQYQAISFRKGIARINAGAGSGKTTVLALRVAELIQEGVHPQEILLITFTNKGAEEMREKIAYWLKEMDMDYIDVHRMDILTFNAWGDKVLQKEYSLLGFTEPPTLAEKVQKYDIILEILDKNEKLDGFDYKNPLLDFPKSKGVVVQLAEYFDTIKGKFITDADTLSETLGLVPSLSEKVFHFYKLYEQKLKERNLVEYQDQINLLLQLIENHIEVLDKYAYKHIMIDEFQDSDTMQFDIMSALLDNDKFESLMVVGDDSQSIFGFRHTSPDMILNFHNYFEEVKDIYFVENFRSTPEITEVANRLNDLNTKKINKKLVSQTPNGTKPKLCSYRTLADEYKGITSMIEEKINQGIRPENIAVIARTKNELIMIEKYLKEKDIPVVLDVAEPLLNNKNVQIMISLVNFFENEEIDYSLLEYLYIFQQEQIKKMSTEELKQFVNMFKEELLEGYQGLDEADKVNFYFDTVQQIADVDAVVGTFLEELKEKRFETTHELFSYLKKLVLYKDEKSIEKKDVKYKAVVLTTAHSSKGKEFDVVIHTINHYQYDTSKMKEEEIEEERRILFVAITRAKKELYITYQTNQDRVKIKGTYCKFADELQEVERIS